MRNTNYKLISLLMALVFFLGTVSAVSVSADGQEVPKRTIMFYATGSNLEAQYKCFTKKSSSFRIHRIMKISISS